MAVRPKNSGKTTPVPGFLFKTKSIFLTLTPIYVSLH